MSYYDIINKHKPKGTASESDKTSKKQSTSGYQAIIDRHKPSYDFINDDYLSTFITDANDYFGSLEGETVNWGNAGDVYATRKAKWDDISKREGYIRGWLEANEGNLDSKWYADFLSALDSYKEGGASSMDYFKGATDYYGQWDSEEAYKAYHPEEYKDIIASEEAALGWQEYVKAVEAAQNAEDNRSWFERFSDFVLKANAMQTQGDPFSAQFQATVNAYREDQSYRMPKDDWTEEQKLHFGALYRESSAKAYAYAEAVNKYNAEEKEKAAIEEIKADATDNWYSGIGHSLASVAASTLGAADLLNDLAMGAAGRDIGADGYISPFEYSQAVKSGISDKLNEFSGTIGDDVWVFGGKGVGDLYGLGMSIVESLGTQALGGPAALLVPLGKAGAAGVDEAISRGASTDQALLYGAVLGTIEAATEKIGLDNLFKTGSATTFKGFMKNIGKQAATEAGEEGLNSIFSNVADNLIMGDKSNFNALVQQYMDDGLSESEATKKAWKQTASDIAFDTVTGAASGAVSGSVFTGAKTGLANYKTKKYYGGQSQALVDEALSSQFSEVKAVGQKYQDKLKSGKTLSGANLSRLIESTDSSKLKSAVLQRLGDLGEKGDVTAIADVLIKQARGEKLSSSDVKILNNSTAGHQVSTELNRDNIMSGNLGNEWSESIGTRRIDPESYSRSGQTVYVGKDGKSENVSIKKIVSTKGGTLSYELSDGRIVSQSDIKYGSEREATAHNVVSKMGVSAETANAIVRAVKTANGNTPGFYAGIPLAYEYGKIGNEKGLKNVNLPDNIKKFIYDLGVSDASKNTSGGKKNEGKAGIRVRDSGKRDGGKNTEGNVSAVESDTGKDKGREGKSADSEAARLVDKGRKVNGADLGIEDAVEGRSVTVIDDESSFTAAMKEAKRLGEERGLKVTLFVGDNIALLDEDGNEFEARGHINPDTKEVFVRADHSKYTAEQIMKHEVGHDMIAKGEVNIDEVRERVKNIVGADNIDELAEIYIMAYAGSGLTEAEIWEELICDSLADMNIFSDNLIGELAKIAMPGIKDVALSTKGNANSTRAPPATKASYDSIRYSFFGDKQVEISDFTDGSYKETEGYKKYVSQCLNNMRQTVEGFNEADALKEIEDSIEGIVNVAVAMKKAGYDILDSEAKRETQDSKNRLLFSSLEPNSDYFTSSDISTICDKRINFAEIYDEIVRREEALNVPRGKRFFDNVDNYFVIHKIMADMGLTQPCRQCYVESMRKNLAPMANSFLKLMQETDPNNKANDQLFHTKGKDKGKVKSNNTELREKLLKAIADEEYDITADTLTVEMLTTEDGLAQLKLQAPLIYEAFNSFYGQSKPKMPKSATPFRFGELTALLTDNKGKINKRTVKKILSTGGFRLQSYSDFQIQNFADVLQVIFEAGTLGLNGHAYTKVPAFLDATKGTNLKRNISIFMYNDGGQWKIDRNDSFPYTLDAIYDIVNADEKGNTSIIAVTQNEMMAAWVMANDNIGYFIPFHKSGLKMGTVRETVVREGGREIKGYSGIKDHTRQQTEVWASSNDKHTANTKVDHGINIYEFWDFENADNLSKNELIEKNVKAYIDACNEAGYLPKFREYVMNNDKVLNAVLTYAKELGTVPQDATIDDISFEYKGYRIPYGYYKCLGDFGMFTPDGKASTVERLSLKDYNFDDAVAYFSKAETLRRNEILQQIANGEERERYRNSNMTTAEIAEEVQSKREAVIQKVVNRGKSSRELDTVQINEAPSDRDYAAEASGFIDHIDNVLRGKGKWYSSDVIDYIQDHPELNYIERIFAKDKAVKSDLDAFLGGVDDIRTLDRLSWFFGEAYGQRAPRWGSNGRTVYPYQGAVRTFRNAIKRRINEIMTAKVNGTNLGLKNGASSLDEVKDFFYRLNSNEEIGAFAEKVFATAERLGVNIRFVNQTFARGASGNVVGDMVEYKTSYFNDTAVSDQSKASTILHELIHSCTVYVLNANKTSGDVYYRNKTKNYESIANAATRLNRIFWEIKNDPDFKGEYGTKDTMEMVAELADVRFVAKLKQKSLWQEILDWICELFGFTRGTSAYDNAMACVDYILDNPEIEEYKAFAKGQRRAARSGGLDVFGVTYDTNGQAMYSRELDLANVIGEEVDSVSTRTLLANALDTVATTEEKDLLSRYRARIEDIEKLQAQLDTNRAEAKTLRFKKGVTPEERARLAKLDAEAKRLEERINKHDKKLLELESTEALKKVVEREKKKARQKALEDSKKSLEKRKVRMAESELRQKIQKMKQKFMTMLQNPTDSLYVPEELATAIISVCEAIDTSRHLYKPNGEINKAQAKRNAAMAALADLKRAYENIQNDPDSMVKEEYDEEINNALLELQNKYSGKNIADMTLDDLNVLYEILRSIDDTLRDARKVIGLEDFEYAADVGEAIIDEQREVRSNRKNGEMNWAESVGNSLLDKSLSPMKAIYRMVGYNEDSPLYQLFRDIEQGVWQKEKFVMDSTRAFEELTTGKNAKAYEDAMYKPFGDEITDTETGKKFKVTKMQMMQAVLSYEREQANSKLHHVTDGGFTFADVKYITKGKLSEAVDADNAHTVQFGAVLAMKFKTSLKGDAWAQEYMAKAREFFNKTARKAINDVTVQLKHRIVASETAYIPFEVNENFVNQEITAENSIQKTISGYGMLKDLVHSAPQPIVITGLNNVLQRHIEQVGNIHGLAIPIRDFNKVWNIKFNNTVSVKNEIERNWHGAGTKLITQAIMDVQGPRKKTQSDFYLTLKSGIITAKFVLNGSVVFKQVGSAFTASAMLKVRNPVAVISNLIYTMAHHKEIAAEVDKYTAAAWIRRQGLSDAEMHTLMTQARKTPLSRFIDQKLGVINPAKWITAMDSAVALSLWKYTKEDVAERTGLTGEELLKVAARTYEDVIANTQSMSDSLHRPEIQKSGGIGSELLGTFKTDLYQTAGNILVALEKYRADPTKENKNAMLRTVYGAAISSLWSSVFVTALFAALRYKVNPYRDEEDNELTLESWLTRLAWGVGGDLASYIFPLLGGEIVDGFEAAFNKDVAGDVADTIVLSAVDDYYEGLSSLANKLVEGKPAKAQDYIDLGVKTLEFMGIPAYNVMRTYNAFKNHIIDAINGEFLSFEAGNDRTSKQKRNGLYNAMIEGDSDKIAKYESMFADDKAIASALKKALRENDPRIKEAAMAAVEGKISKRLSIEREIREEGNFEARIIRDAIDLEIKAIESSGN